MVHGAILTTFSNKDEDLKILVTGARLKDLAARIERFRERVCSVPSVSTQEKINKILIRRSHSYSPLPPRKPRKPKEENTAQMNDIATLVQELTSTYTNVLGKMQEKHEEEVRTLREQLDATNKLWGQKVIEFCESLDLQRNNGSH